MTEHDFARLDVLRRARISRVMTADERAEYERLIKAVWALGGSMALFLGIDRDPPAFVPPPKPDDRQWAELLHEALRRNGVYPDATADEFTLEEARRLVPLIRGPGEPVGGAW